MPEPVAILKITREERSPPFATQAILIGSGFLVASEVMVTCRHVLCEAFGVRRPSASPCLVAALAGDAFRIREADIVAVDEGRDLALIHLANAASFEADVFELATELPQAGQSCDRARQDEE